MRLRRSLRFLRDEDETSEKRPLHMRHVSYNRIGCRCSCKDSLQSLYRYDKWCFRWFGLFHSMNHRLLTYHFDKPYCQFFGWSDSRWSLTHCTPAHWWYYQTVERCTYCRCYPCTSGSLGSRSSQRKPNVVRAAKAFRLVFFSSGSSV